MEVRTLKDLLYVIAVKRFMEKFRSIIEKRKILFKDISIEADKNYTAFSKTISSAAMPELLSFLRFWFAYYRLSCPKNRADGIRKDLEVLFTQTDVNEILLLASLFSQNKEDLPFDPNEFGDEQMDLFMTLKEDVHHLYKIKKISGTIYNLYGRAYIAFKKRKENKQKNDGL